MREMQMQRLTQELSALKEDLGTKDNRMK
jgi:regulator of replication initiation timing